MPDFEITSGSDPRFSVRLADCTPEHAQSVLDQLHVEPTVPSDLTLTDLTPLPVVAAEPSRRRFVGRLLGR